MKYSSMFLVIIIGSIQVPNKAFAYNISENICQYIAADDKNRLRKLLKDNHLKLRKLFSDITCNKDNMLLFAAKRNSLKVGEFIVKKMSKSILKKSVTSVKEVSPEIAAFMNNRIN